MSELEKLREMVIDGIRLSGQSSYLRGAPDPRALPTLGRAARELRELVRDDERSGDTWRLLSQVEEVLLNYRAAISALERAMALAGRRSKSDLRRMARMREQEQALRTPPLSSDQWSDLRAFLRKRIASDRSLHVTEEWLHESGIEGVDDVVERLRRAGYDSDSSIRDAADI